MRSVPTLCLHDSDFLFEKQTLTFYQDPQSFGFSAFVFQASIDRAILAHYSMVLYIFIAAEQGQKLLFNSYSILMPFVYQIWDLIS